jgi:hypothetical protein
MEQELLTDTNHTHGGEEKEDSLSVTYGGRCFFLCHPVFPIHKTENHDITGILLKLAYLV